MGSGTTLKALHVGISRSPAKPLLCSKQFNHFIYNEKDWHFYGSSTGTCEELANQIAEKLGVSSTDVHSVDKMTADKIKEYEVLVLGTSTWGDGELQDDWYDGVKVLKNADISMKFVALFGCGDSESYCDTFCDGIGVLYEDLKDSGCTFLGNKVSTNGYSFSSSIAVVDGAFVGLPLDEVNESDKTAERIDAWTAEIKASSRKETDHPFTLNGWSACIMQMISFI